MVVVGHNHAARLHDLTEALLPQLREDDELVIVDNASSDATAARARAVAPRATVLELATNAGFAGGVRAGVTSTAAPLLLLLNPDCQPQPGALEELRKAATEHPDWAAWQAAVMLPDGHINSSGGVVHFLGMGWAGDCGRPAAALPDEPREVAFPSGAAMVVRRSAWDQLDGMEDSYFTYVEDLDLGLRLWLAGLGVGVIPQARVIHDYDFHKGAAKWFWLERNRWRTVLAVYPAPLLIALLPALLAAEIALVAVAARQGWLRAKLRAQAAVLVNLPSTLARRARVQRTRRIGVADFARRLTASTDSPYLSVGRPAEAAAAAYWALVSGALERLGR